MSTDAEDRPRHAVWRADVAPTRRMLAAAGALVVLCVAVFVLIAEDVLDGGGLIARDEPALRWFLEHRSDWWVDAAKLVSALGGFASLAVAGAVLGIWLWRRRWNAALAVSPLAALVLGAGASVVAKELFDRGRPPVAVQATTVHTAAFPSGHATDAAAFFLAASFVLALTLARRRSVQLVLVAAGAFLAAVVGVSRLVLAVHWLSDVVAGWALGTAIAITTVVTVWALTGSSAVARRR